ncbi:MAG: hypothetical protein H0W83_03775, partial [Planctomycetes bacterium]|nr:hypothetical protein [Planctomycetota bacterium]
VLYWASRCAGDAAAARGARAELFALRRNDLATALGWCAEAEDLDRGGTDAAEAWGRAAAMLPPHHPWRPEAAWRAARNLVAAGDLERARALLDGEASWGGDDEPHLRCRYLLVQVLERGGDRAGALRAAESIAAALPPEADAERRARVEGVIRRLRQDH